ncbi:MAG: ATP-binding protein [Acidimicrobiia bacterium]
MTFDVHPSSVRRARRYFTDTARDLRLADDAIAAGALALSEIMTNAVVHGAPPIELRIRADGEVVQLEVSDAGSAFPEPVADSMTKDRAGGHGLAIVAAVAGTWGCRVEPGRPGKTVFFSLPLAPEIDPVEE